MKTNYISLILIFVSVITAHAQSKKDIKINKVTSEAVYITVVKDGKEVTLKDTYTVYDKNGCVLEETEFYEDGTIKRKEINTYDTEKNKTSEEIFDGKDKKNKKFSYIYNNQNEKTGEIEYDENGKVIKQSVIVYDNKGLKIEKQTFDGDKQLLFVKKYVYNYR